MNSLVQNHYCASKNPSGEGFEEVVYLGESSLSLDEVHEKDPLFPRGWYELSHLNVQDRIDFSREYWAKTLPFHPEIHNAIGHIFEEFDDIGFYLVKEMGENYRSEMVYSLRSGAAFFSGKPPLHENQVIEATASFQPFPKDFLAFYKIHDGFFKNGDIGILPAEALVSKYQLFSSRLKDQEKVIRCKGISVDPTLLIPFYERFGLQSYQCFYGDWYPTSEMGNVFYSGIDDTISDFKDPERRLENMAFPTFSGWLSFYLEGRET